MSRKLFGNPIRKGITDEFFPNKLSIDDFEEQIVNHFQAYKQNMKHINADEEKYIEEWVEQYLSWLEIEQE